MSIGQPIGYPRAQSIPVASPVQGLLRSANRAGLVTASTSANITFTGLWTTDSHFDLVRGVYVNDTLTAYDLGGACVAPSAAVNDGYNPVDANGAAVAFTPLTFSNAGADGLYDPTQTNTALTVTVAAASQTKYPALTFSDWVPVSSLSRTDGGRLPILMARQYHNTAGRALRRQALVPSWENPDINRGRLMKGWNKGGNFANPPASLTGASADSGYWSPGFIQWYSRTRGVTVLAVGDSLTQGLQSTSDVNCWGHQATAAISTLNRPVSFFNAGVSGQQSVDYHYRAKVLIDAVKPEIVTLATWSPNDASITQAGIDLAWSRTIGLAHYAISRGIVPILMTPIPWAGLNAAGDALRMQMVTRCRALADTGGILCADFDAVLRDAQAPPRLQASYNDGDGLHPNDRGHAAMAGVFTALLRRIL